MPDASPETVAKFIERWEKSGGSEKANYALFFTELCDEILHVPHPEPAGPDNAKNLYVFERAVTHQEADGTTATGFIDLYKSGFLLSETKQGTFSKAVQQGTLLDFIPSKSPQKSGHGKRGTAAFDKVLQRAYNQARKYITALPASEGRPPFLIVCDVGHSIDLYAEFSGTGGHYERFPDPASFRIYLADLHRPKIRERLRKIWTDPHSLDPSKHSAKVTREVARSLAELAKSLEKDGHDAKVTAGFLQRCLFTMFAEDVELLPKNSFLNVMDKVKDSPAGFPIMLQTLWHDMATGTKFSTVLLNAVPHFNGGLFEDTTALPLRPDQMALLIHAAKSDWSAVEPAIFGTLVERALDPRERHKLGAHYTPRSYVERLIRPALIDPLREEWDAVKAAASLATEKAAKSETADAELAAVPAASLSKTQAADIGKKRREFAKQAASLHEEAIGAVRDFHRKICTLKVLDPACGSGNFLYVALELMKRLEAEVIEAFDELGGDAAFEMASFKIGPRQFLGLELNRRAVAIAQLVLWIGFFQWQRKTTGKADTNERPLLPKEASIVQQDAVLAYDAAIPRKDPDSGEIVTIWDGVTTKQHPITGKEVPDETARKAVFDYTNPKRAEWPQADVIVGNPPFIGNKRMRDALGDGYSVTLRKAWKDCSPESWDFVMYWWQKAAELVRDGKALRFGFITTNSITQSFNRRCLESFLTPEGEISLAYAIPDHPWVDSVDGAAVRIALTVGVRGPNQGDLVTVVSEVESSDGESFDVELRQASGKITPDLKIGADTSSAIELAANKGLCGQGIKLVGDGFYVDDGFQGTAVNSSNGYPIIRTIVNPTDILQSRPGRRAIDFAGLTDKEALALAPAEFQKLLTEVKPLRDSNARPSIRDIWWRFAWERPELRKAIHGLERYFVTLETSKHRFLVAVSAEVLWDGSLFAIATDDWFVSALLGSQVHVCWSLANGGRLGPTPRYNRARCFETFPFPALEESPLKQRIRDLGERLDAHRKQQQALHPDLTLTGMYNVLEAVRAGTPLTAKEKAIHDKGLVSILQQIHDDLDAAVLEAYGWSDLTKRDANKEAPHSCGAGECAAIEKREALPNGVPFTPPQECGGSLKETLEAELLTRLVALNHARAAEEKKGLIRWLRPDYQNPGRSNNGHRPPLQGTLAGTETQKHFKPDKSSAALIWPATLSAQVTSIQKLIPAHGQNAETLAAQFGKKNAKRTQQVTEILETLQGLGKL